MLALFYTVLLLQLHKLSVFSQHSRSTLVEQGLTSHRTHYRSYRRLVL